MSAANDDDEGGPNNDVSPQRKVPVTSDQDVDVIDAKKKRGRAKGLLTKQMGIIDKMTTDINNIAQVKERMDYFPESIERFEAAHNELLRLLTNKYERLQAEDYKSDTMGEVIDFQVALNNWIAQQEDEDVNMPEGEEWKKLHDAAIIDNSARSDPFEVCIEAENKALEDDIKELSKKQQLEIWNRQLALQRERRIFVLEKMKIESELILKREKQQMIEEQKKLELK